MSTVGGMLLLTKNTSTPMQKLYMEKEVGEKKMEVQCFFLARPSPRLSFFAKFCGTSGTLGTRNIGIFPKYWDFGDFGDFGDFPKYWDFPKILGSRNIGIPKYWDVWDDLGRLGRFGRGGKPKGLP